MIGEKARKVLENNLGLPYEQQCGLDINEEVAFVKTKTGQSLEFVPDSRKIGRGNPLLAKGKITPIEEINKKINALRI